MSPVQGLKRIVKERSRASVRDYWGRNKGFIAWVVLAIAVAAASIQSYLAAEAAQNGVNQINEERVSRVNAQSSINAFFCQQNNHQNAILGRLVEISLEGAPQPVTRRQTHELRSVEEVEHRLTQPTNCHELALQLAKATGVNPSQVKITPLVGVALEHLGHVGHHGRRGDTESARGTGSEAGGGEGGGRRSPSVTLTPTGAGTGSPQQPSAGGGGSSQPAPTHHHETHNHPAGGHGGHGHGGGSGPESPGSNPPPPSPEPEPGPEEERAPGGSNQNSLKVCALQPLLPKCIEAEVQL